MTTRLPTDGARLTPAQVAALLDAAGIDPVDAALALRGRVREADDHFYGPWFGGSKSAGGRPGRGPTAAARREDMADKVGAENVGNIANIPGRADAAKGDGPPKAVDGGARDAAPAEGGRDIRDWGAGPTVSPEEAYRTLSEGGSPNVKPNDVAKVLELARDGQGHPDLTDLQVDGTMNFGGNGLGIKRIDMPQLPGDRLPKYLDHMRSRGISVTEEMVEPGRLSPIQSEVSAKKVAGILQSMRDGTLPVGSIVITKDDFVLDGHHRWGAGTALGFERSGVQIKAVRIGMDARELLPDALRWTAAEGIQNKSITEAAAIIEAAWERWDRRFAAIHESNGPSRAHQVRGA